MSVKQEAMDGSAINLRWLRSIEQALDEETDSELAEYGKAVNLRWIAIMRQVIESPALELGDG